jgi:glycosyltransferase involved in cell wall biosynthesis
VSDEVEDFQQGDNTLPVVSFIIPAYNAEDTLNQCLHSIFSQSYPRNKMEVLVIDNGSTDSTLEIASKYPVKILYCSKQPPFGQEGKDGAKAVGLRAATGELIAFVDADNILCSKEWLKKMVHPFLDTDQLVVCETSRRVRTTDSALNRYCSSLIGKTPRTDPFFLAYSKAPKNVGIHKNGVFYFKANAHALPCLANGTIVRKNVLDQVGGYDYDTDTALRIIELGYNRFGKVLDVGIYHQYIDNPSEYLRKCIWRLRFFLSSKRSRNVGPVFSEIISDKQSQIVLVLDVLSGFTILAPLIYANKKFKEEKDSAWFCHPFISFMTPLIYSMVLLSNSKNISKIFVDNKNDKDQKTTKPRKN